MYHRDPHGPNLLVNTKDVVPSLGLLCSNAGGMTLATFNNAALLSSIASLALRVSFSDLPNICALYLFFKNDFLSFSLLFIDHYLGY